MISKVRQSKILGCKTNGLCDLIEDSAPDVDDEASAAVVGSCGCPAGVTFTVVSDRKGGWERSSNTRQFGEPHGSREKENRLEKGGGRENVASENLTVLCIATLRTIV
jgi:hypothetical protein